MAKGSDAAAETPAAKPYLRDRIVRFNHKKDRRHLPSGVTAAAPAARPAKGKGKGKLNRQEGKGKSKGGKPQGIKKRRRVKRWP